MSNKLRNGTNTNQNALVKKIITYTFLDNVNAYLEHFEDIQMRIQLAKLGVLNIKLVDVETISHLNAEQFKFIRTLVWRKKDLLYFVLTVPEGFKAFQRYTVFTIPDNNNEELILNLDADF